MRYKYPVILIDKKPKIRSKTGSKTKAFFADVPQWTLTNHTFNGPLRHLHWPGRRTVTVQER